MAIVITLSVRKVYLGIVVPDEFPVRLPHLIQRGSFVEVVIRETPHDPNYVELKIPIRIELAHHFLALPCRS